MVLVNFAPLTASIYELILNLQNFTQKFTFQVQNPSNYAQNHLKSPFFNFLFTKPCDFPFSKKFSTIFFDFFSLNFLVLLKTHNSCIHKNIKQEKYPNLSSVIALLISTNFFSNKKKKTKRKIDINKENSFLILHETMFNVSQFKCY